MLSVAIMINGNPIMARSVVNKENTTVEIEHAYLVDDGSVIYHDPDDGAVKLAIKLFETIKEQR